MSLVLEGPQGPVSPTPDPLEPSQVAALRDPGQAEVVLVFIRPSLTPLGVLPDAVRPVVTGGSKVFGREETTEEVTGVVTLVPLVRPRLPLLVGTCSLARVLRQVPAEVSPSTLVSAPPVPTGAPTPQLKSVRLFLAAPTVGDSFLEGRPFEAPVADPVDLVTWVPHTSDAHIPADEEGEPTATLRLLCAIARLGPRRVQGVFPPVPDDTRVV